MKLKEGTVVNNITNKSITTKKGWKEEENAIYSLQAELTGLIKRLEQNKEESIVYELDNVREQCQSFLEMYDKLDPYNMVKYRKE